MKDTQEPIPLALILRAVRRQARQLLGSAAHSRVFLRGYTLFSLVVLFGTTLLWATLGARLQGQNADQLSDPYLFSTWKTFHGASFPGAHTFLLKWPVFWLLNVVGVNAHSLVVATVALVMMTVATLVLVLYKINHRPLVFGTICLGLSLALLLVPAQPYAGALLPVNMAMLTTRNIEYAVYLTVLVLFAYAKRIRTWSFASGTVLLAILVASDKLFLSLSIGGALLALVAYALLRAWGLVSFSVRWLAGSIIAAVASTALLSVIAARHITHIVNSASANPYGLTSGVRHMVLGVVYAFTGLLTNVGANPIYDNLVLRQLPNDLKDRLLTWSTPAYGIAALSLLYVLLLAWRTIRRATKGSKTMVSVANKLAFSLLWSTVAAFGVFIVTNHYYPVDSRYLTISLFALAVLASVGLRTTKRPRPELLLLAGCVLSVAAVIASLTSVHISDHQTTALTGLSTRNDTVIAALKQHETNLLVGDYWRVLPIKLSMNGSLTSLPLASCTQPTGALTSSVWQPDLHKTKFAYLLTISGSVTNFPNCSIQTVAAAYGKPDSTQVIAGSLDHPTEAILFYDRGIQRKTATPAVVSAAPSTILPISADQLTDATCMGPTIMNIVAHEDDDILFMSPDLLHEIQAGDCVRTVYLTAGNDGLGKLYWLSRQLGAEAAYDSMLGSKHVWEQRTVKLANKEYVTVANPRGNAKITLLFFNLPDGNLKGEGFPISNFESLAKLRSGTIKAIRTVDQQSEYTTPQLVDALTQFMEVYGPSIIQTQADLTRGADPDHSDHIETSLYAQSAAKAYDQKVFVGQITVPVRRYIGYPIQGRPANVSGDDLARKTSAFYAYGHFDTSTCDNVADCDRTTYSLYLARQYQE